MYVRTCHRFDGSEQISPLVFTLLFAPPFPFVCFLANGYTYVEQKRIDGRTDGRAKPFISIFMTTIDVRYVQQQSADRTRSLGNWRTSWVNTVYSTYLWEVLFCEMSSGHQKWARNLFWGQGRDYDDAWSLPRSDCGNEYRQRLFYDIATRVQPKLSRRIRIIGGDVVPGVRSRMTIRYLLEVVEKTNKYLRSV